MSKVQFAQLDKGLNLHHDDFMAIAFKTRCRTGRRVAGRSGMRSRPPEFAGRPGFAGDRVGRGHRDGGDAPADAVACPPPPRASGRPVARRDRRR